MQMNTWTVKSMPMRVLYFCEGRLVSGVLWLDSECSGKDLRTKDGGFNSCRERSR